MAVGGCFCGKIRVKLDGQPQIALCHCNDCRKLTGSPYTYNFVIKSADLSIISGTPKEIAKTADTGNYVKNYFCPDCGTPLFGRKVKEDGEPADEATIVRAGIFDDQGLLSGRSPEVEIYTERRLEWIAPVEGAAQIEGMYSP